MTRTRVLSTLLAVVLAVVLAAPLSNAAAQQAPAVDPATPLTLDPLVKVGSLPNGLRYFIRENEWPANRAELRLVVNVGSIVEDDDQLGLAHFTEHMAFNGTAQFPKQELVQ